MAPSVKKKSRFETLDLAASLRELQPLIGSKVVNIYDAAAGGSQPGGSFVFKLAGGSAPAPDGAPGMSKHHLLV
eukprot:CAMPEP_0194283018 /NCGR_PEP_ID=MMETSP0169-20130528/24509_1 /TAXON_ID=218684 /ORGANISM="Corethron pennatum, Strain L29A3" /LENGTH=73 /DNA_ID=CAMNT_0039028531 /DNA_START=45 /DNA_END=263 /DNA_ORIENTATION=-